MTAEHKIQVVPDGEMWFASWEADVDGAHVVQTHTAPTAIEAVEGVVAMVRSLIDAAADARKITRTLEAGP